MEGLIKFWIYLKQKEKVPFIYCRYYKINRHNNCDYKKSYSVKYFRISRQFTVTSLLSGKAHSPKET